MRLPFLKIGVRRSLKNGWIITTRAGEVWARGAKQTSVRYSAMWSDALVRADIKNPVSSVLMLGLAGGGALTSVYSMFPGARVTAVEYDPAMVSAARDLLRNAPFPFPEVIVADAQDAITELEGTYDLVLVDIFIGPHPSPLISSATFWSLLKSRLGPGAKAVLNVAGSSTKVHDAQKHFATHTTWQFRANTFTALS